MPKKAQLDRSLLVGAVIGAAVLLAVSAALCGLLALLVSSGRVGEGSRGELVTAAALLASIAGALTAWRKNGGAAFLSGTLSAVIAVALRLLLTILTGGSLGGSALTISAAMLLGGILTGFLAAGRKKRRRRRG